MAFIPNSNSVVAFQSDPTKLVGTFSVVGNMNSSVAVVSTVPASVSGVGTFNINPVGNGSIIGTLINSSVTALQGTNPWFVQLTSGSVITTGGNSSVQVVGTLPPTSVSGVGTFNINPIGNGSVIAVLTNSSVTALQGTNPWIIGNSSVQVVGAIPPTSVSGVGLFNVNHIGNGSILVLVPGSVATVSSPASVSGVGVFSNNHIGNGSIITVFSIPSIVGTYAEDAPSADGDKGLFVLGIRNDTVSSLVSADKDYGALTSDSAGRVLVKPFAAEEARVEGYNSVVSTSVTTLVAAAGTGLKNYITDIMIANTGATTALITFKDGAGSILGYTIAPTGGGSNVIGMNMPMKTGANATFDFQPATASSVIYATVKGYKAP